jgi:phosphopantetheinyl transferase
LFIVFADENVGVDAENTKRDVAYQPILKRFCNEERNAIQTKDDFLSLWTVKESAVKWLGGTLARDLKKLRYVDGVLQYDGIDVPVLLTQKRVDENIVTICCVRDFKNVEMVAFP